MRKTLIRIVLAVLIGVPTAYVWTFLLTPVYWKLEPVLGIELAGHSGPSDWVFVLDFIVTTAVVFVLIRLFWKSPGAGSASNPPEAD